MPPCGVLNVYKPAGHSSREVVDCVINHLGPTKAGHAGTLDPLAMGVLVVCIGQATRLIQYVQRMPKRYVATFLLGQRSRTDDIEGEVEVIAGAPVPARDAIERARVRFVGDIQQRPPDHSAVKVAGRRAYRLARQGKAVELAARTVTIHRLKVCRYEYPELVLDIECGSGTYVRALGRDLAAALGTGAVMSALERRSIGGFRSEDGVALESLSRDSILQHIQPALVAVADLPLIELSDAQWGEIRRGRPIPNPHHGPAEFEEWAAVNTAGELLAILRRKRPGELWPEKNLA